MDSGAVDISDDEEMKQLRRQSREVYAKSFIVAVILTVIALVP
jgi:hypothetical protein